MYWNEKNAFHVPCKNHLMSQSSENTDLHNQLLWSLDEEQYNKFTVTLLKYVN